MYFVIYEYHHYILTQTPRPITRTPDMYNKKVCSSWIFCQVADRNITGVHAVMKVCLSKVYKIYSLPQYTFFLIIRHIACGPPFIIISRALKLLVAGLILFSILKNTYIPNWIPNQIAKFYICVVELRSEDE